MILYVSWGGAGWAGSVREAMRQAMLDAGTERDGGVPGGNRGDRGLRYLAVLDDGHFADLDQTLLALVIEELRWLLDAQLELTRRQLGANDLPIEVVVSTGDVVDAVVDIIEQRGPAKVLVGAPLPSEQTMEVLRKGLRERTATEVELVAGPS